jgi:hypothetical protein
MNRSPLRVEADLTVIRLETESNWLLSLKEMLYRVTLRILACRLMLGLSVVRVSFRAWVIARDYQLPSPSIIFTTFHVLRISHRFSQGLFDALGLRAEGWSATFRMYKRAFRRAASRVSRAEAGSLRLQEESGLFLSAINIISFETVPLTLFTILFS